jgi:hypothetical protein
MPLPARLVVALLIAASGAAHGARTDVDFRWTIDFVAFAASALGLQPAGTIAGTATFDDTMVDPVARTVTVPGDAPPGGPSFRVEAGNLVFEQSDDQLGGPMITLDAAGRVAGVEFLPGPIALAGGDYLLSFSGSQFLLTPSGSLADILAAGQLQPIPGPSEWLFASLGFAAIGAIAARRARRR